MPLDADERELLEFGRTRRMAVRAGISHASRPSTHNRDHPLSAPAWAASSGGR